MHTENAPTPPPIPAENAPYIMDETTLNKEIHQAGVLSGMDRLGNRRRDNRDCN